MIMELEQRMNRALANSPTRRRNPKSKLECSQIDDGDFEKIMIGKLIDFFCGKHFINPKDSRAVNNLDYLRLKRRSLCVVRCTDQCKKAGCCTVSPEWNATSSGTKATKIGLYESREAWCTLGISVVIFLQSLLLLCNINCVLLIF